MRSHTVLVFKMTISVATLFEDNEIISSWVGQQIPLLCSTVWISLMNSSYKRVATYFNNLENYRTETEYNDQLIFKTVAFQFVNSYILLFYVAFFKANEAPMGFLFNARDETTGEFYRDMCGARPKLSTGGLLDFPFANVNPSCTVDDPQEADCKFVFIQRDCQVDLRALMVSYTLLKPCYEIPLQIVPIIIECIRRFFTCCCRCCCRGHGESTSERSSSTSSRGKKSTATVQVLGNSEPSGGSKQGGDGKKTRTPPRSSKRSKALFGASDASSVPPDAPPSPPHNMAAAPSAPHKLESLPPPPSPPPSPGTASGEVRGLESSIDAATLDHKRLEFHEKIKVESEQAVYPGTFSEYNTKVVQYGYVACFSSVFPLAAICAAAGNLIELRIDSFNLLSHRRPRYRRAQDIGSWQTVLNFISWAALPINVLILVFSSWDFRNMLVVPLVLYGSPTAPGAYSCYEPAHAALFEAQPSNFTNAFGELSFVSADATVSHHAQRLGRRTSYLAECIENVQDCYAPIGGVWWLPGVEYLPPTARTTESYTDQGLCNRHSKLYNEAHCRTCLAWTNTVWRTQLIIALIVEHLLLLLKLFLDAIIPDRPRWVVDANARKAFQKELSAATTKRKLLRDSVDLDALHAEDEAAVRLILPDINASDDKDDTAPQARLDRAHSGYV